MQNCTSKEKSMTHFSASCAGIMNFKVMHYIRLKNNFSKLQASLVSKEIERRFQKYKPTIETECI
jgi:hypothetical protein